MNPPPPGGRTLWRRFRATMTWSPPKFLVASPSNAGLSLRMELSAPRRWTEKRKQAWEGPDQVEQRDPPDRERRDVTQDSQAGTGGRRKAARTENAQRAESACSPAVQCDPCAETGRPATQKTHGGIGCRKKDDRGERACRSENVRQVDGRRDLRADSERENRAEAGNFQTCSREDSGGDRSSSKNLMVKPLETRTNLDVDRSRSFALRG